MARNRVDRESRDMLAGVLRGLLDGRISSDEILNNYATGWSGLSTSSDPVISGILDEIHNLDGLFEGEDCGFWKECNDICRTCHKCNPKSACAKRSNAKRTIARSVEFLKTDCQYKWDESTRLPWWMVLPAFIVLLVGIILSIVLAFPLAEILTKHGIKVDESPFLMAGIIVTAITWLWLFSTLSNKARGKDKRYWPFYGLKEWEKQTQYK
jgi:hypothetical protein